MEFVTRTRKDLESLNYAALRSAAQSFGIKSNQKAAALVDQILDPSIRVYVRGKEPKASKTSTSHNRTQHTTTRSWLSQKVPEVPKAGPSQTQHSLSPLSPEFDSLRSVALDDVLLNNEFTSAPVASAPISADGIQDALLAPTLQSGSALLSALESDDGAHFPTSVTDFVQTFGAEVHDEDSFRQHVEELGQKLEHTQARIASSKLIYEANRVANALVDLYIQEVQVKNVAAIYEIEDLRNRIAATRKEMYHRFPSEEV